MLRGKDYATGEDVFIPGWLERFIDWLFEILRGE